MRIQLSNMLQTVLLALFALTYSSYAKAEKYDLVVAQDGSGDFTSIQKAIDACRIFPDKPFTIRVKNGVYREKIAILEGNTDLTIIGESADKTIIAWDDYFDKVNRGRNSTFYTSTLKVEANDFRMENITVENSAGPVGQALALSVEGDRCVFVNCRFLGNQDTIYAAGRLGRQYFYNCYIEGTTDFIFGEATAVFEKCTIHAKANSYITAASTAQGKPFGYVFLNCKITAAAGIGNVYLGRPWRGFAKVAFLNCEMGAFILPEGWDNWLNTENEKTVNFLEYKNTGAGADRSKRVSWSHELTKKEASNFTKEKIFAPFVWEVSRKKWYEL
jgi:pectinesterase